MEGDHAVDEIRRLVALISIHALRVEGDRSCISSRCRTVHFYPRPPGGGRPGVILYCSSMSTFLSTPSGWRATYNYDLRDLAAVAFLSTPSGWRATLELSRVFSKVSYFYPRPPGGGRLPYRFRRPLPPRNFYPRPPGGGRQNPIKIKIVIIYFYPRPPGGGRRDISRNYRLGGFYFYPRPPGGGRLCAKRALSAEKSISIHALRVEGDLQTVL